MSNSTLAGKLSLISCKASRYKLGELLTFYFFDISSICFDKLSSYYKLRKLIGSSGVLNVLLFYLNNISTIFYGILDIYDIL